MDWIIVAGCLCLGILIGAIVGWFINESQHITPRILGAAISALVGSSVLAMFSFLAGLRGPTSEYWFYPIGLLVGFVAVTVIELRYYDYYGDKRKRSENSN